MIVAGHTDNVGKDEYNLGLSQRRAQAVTNYFKSKGLAGSRFTTNGMVKETLLQVTKLLMDELKTAV